MSSTAEIIAQADKEVRDVDDGGKQLHFSFWTREKFGLLTEDELATVLGVKKLTLAKWRRDSRGPKFVAPGKTVFYRAQDIAAWLGSNAHPAGALHVVQVDERTIHSCSP